MHRSSDTTAQNNDPPSPSSPSGKPSRSTSPTSDASGAASGFVAAPFGDPTAWYPSMLSN